MKTHSDLNKTTDKREKENTDNTIQHLQVPHSPHLLKDLITATIRSNIMDSYSNMGACRMFHYMYIYSYIYARVYTYRHVLIFIKIALIVVLINKSHNNNNKDFY